MELVEGFEKESDPLLTYLDMPVVSERTQGWLREDRAETKFPWEHNRSPLREDSRRQAIKYCGNVRDGWFCTWCTLPIIAKTSVTLNHIDFDRTNNHRWNLNLCHFKCNSARKRSTLARHSYVGTSEREQTVVAAAGDSELVAQGNSESSKKMNAIIDAWLFDLENGPFVLRDDSGGVVKSSGKTLIVPIEIKLLAIMGAAKLKKEIGRGSQITTERYYRARSRGDVLGEPGELDIVSNYASGDQLVKPSDAKIAMIRREQEFGEKILIRSEEKKP